MRPLPSSPAAPSVVHVSTVDVEDPSMRAMTLVLDLVAREVDPLVATFFRVGADGEIAAALVHGSHLPARELVAAVRSWKLELGGVDPLAPTRLQATRRRVLTIQDVRRGRADRPNGSPRDVYRRIGVINDARMTIRAAGRVVAGLTLWRPHGSGAWSASQLGRLEALQPLAERLYLSSRRPLDELVSLPATLTARQRQVARLLAAGATNGEISRALGISPNTATTHTRAVLAKLGARSRREIAMRPRRAEAAPAGSSEEARRQILELTLDWAARRIGGRIGGCILLSPRLEVVADGWGVAPPPADPTDPSAAHDLHSRLLASLRRGEAIERLAAESTHARVIDLGDRGGRQPPYADLGDLSSLGVSAPLLLTTSLGGRLSCLVWLAVGPDSDRRGCVRALRRAQPLFEAVHQPLLEATRTAGARFRDLSRYGLTPRELAVARLAVAGESNEAIADRLGISRATVKNHMRRVLAKCGVRNRAQLIAVAGRRGAA